MISFLLDRYQNWFVKHKVPMCLRDVENAPVAPRAKISKTLTIVFIYVVLQSWVTVKQVWWIKYSKNITEGAVLCCQNERKVIENIENKPGWSSDLEKAQKRRKHGGHNRVNLQQKKEKTLKPRVFSKRNYKIVKTDPKFTICT